MVEAIEQQLSKYMLEPVRILVWNHLKSMYFLTDENGPKVAQLIDCLYDNDELVFTGAL
jgi:hypothetical protein